MEGDDVLVDIWGGDRLKDNGRAQYGTSIWIHFNDKSIGILVHRNGDYQVTEYWTEDSSHKEIIRGSLARDGE